VAALTGAVTEALTNSAKHADAAHVTLYAAPHDGGIHISIIDDGDGFDPEVVPAGGGLDQSIRARLRAIGGTVTIRSTPGSGTEVELWAP
jgi:signal transduction histidine kinase